MAHSLFSMHHSFYFALMMGWYVDTMYRSETSPHKYTLPVTVLYKLTKLTVKDGLKTLIAGWFI